MTRAELLAEGDRLYALDKPHGVPMQNCNQCGQPIYPDSEQPITEWWLRSMGFTDKATFGMSLEFRKEYGEDVATFNLECCDVANIDDTCWELSMCSIELELSSVVLPCEPRTRGDLRRLMSALGIKEQSNA